MSTSFKHESWTSRVGFLFAAIGAAVGLGNIWKFPYMTGTNGGGAFVVVYILAALLVAIPILIAELMLGRRGSLSPPSAMRINAEKEGRSPAWSLVGWIGVIVGFLILSFYSVIGGWVLHYIVVSAQGFPPDMDAAARFNSLLASPWLLILWHSVFMGLTAWIISAGVSHGIERATKILMPALFIMLLALIIYAAVAGDFRAGLHFMFAVDLTKLTPRVALSAIGQSFFSIGVSMGLMMTYGAYMTRDISIPRTAVIIAAADTLVAVLAGVAIFPLVFANHLQPTEGPGLIFVTLPIAFAHMPAGQIFGPIFFLLVLFAAVTSSISILEPVVSWGQERLGLSRGAAATVFGFLAWLLGITSVLSFNVWKNVHPFPFFPSTADKGFFDLIDYLTSSLLMPVGGLLIAVFAGWRMSRATLVEELAFGSPVLFRVWRLLLQTIVPLSIAAILYTGL